MKELFAQSLSNELADSDRVASAVPGQVGAKNILFSKFWAQLKALFGVNNWSAREYKSSPCIVVYNKQQYILDESVAPLPYTSTDFPTELASNIWLPLGGTTDLSNQPLFSNGLKLGTTPTVGSFEEGKMYYDEAEKTASVQIDSNINLQLGTEELIRGYNNTGATMPNGSVVCKNGAIGDFPIFALAKADALITSDVVAILTQDIPANSYGFGAKGGKIHDLNTSAYSTTDHLFLSDSVAGAMTNIAPTNPTSYVIKVADPLVISATVGSIYCTITRNNRIVDLLDVIASNHKSGDTLVSNGTKFLLKPASPVVGSAASFYLDATVANADNLTLSTTPSAYAEVKNSKACTSGTSPVFFERFVSGALGRTEIPAGLWTFNIFASASSVTGLNLIQFRVNKRVVKSGLTGTFTGAGATRTFTVTDGTPFVPSDANANRLLASLIETPTQTGWISGYTSSSVVTVTLTDPTFVNVSNVPLNAIYYYLFNNETPDLTQTAVNKYVVTTVQPAFTGLNLTDSIVLALFGATDGNRTLSLHYGGSTNYTNFQSPISTKHNDLAGLNDGEYKHLTASEKTALDALIDGGGSGASIASNVSVTPPTGFTSTDMQGLSNEFAAAIPKSKQYQIATNGLTTFLLSISQLEKIVAIPTKYNVADLKLTPILGGADIILIVGGVVQTLPINLAIDTYNATLVYSVGTSNASIIIETQKQ